MGFFFNKSPFASTRRLEKKGKGKGASHSVEDCHREECALCPLHRKESTLQNPKMAPTGKKKPLVYILGEAPGENEDGEGIQFIGKSGKILRNALPEDYEDFVRFNNAIRCHPEGNRDPTLTEIECCRPSIIRDIEKTKPKAIFGFGKFALKWAIDQDKIMAWRGRRIPIKVGEHQCWFYPFLHPSYLGRLRRKNKSTGELMPSEHERVWLKDLDRCFDDVLEAPDAEVFELGNPKKVVECVWGENGWDDVKRVKEQLDYYASRKRIGFDIETTSAERTSARQLRPYGAGARILSMAVSTKTAAFSFALDHPEAKWTPDQRAELDRIIKRFLLRCKAVKVAHNLGFEMEWCGYFYGRVVLRSSPWDDTMCEAFTLDEREGVLSLDALCQQHFGVAMKSLSDVDRRRLSRYPIEQVLTYNGLDALFTAKLDYTQRQLLREQKLLRIAKEYARRVPTCVLTQLAGLPVDFAANAKFADDLQKGIDETVDRIKRMKAVAKYRDKFGKEFKPGGADAVIDIFKMLGFKEEITNKDGKISVDDAALKKIDHPLARAIDTFRELTKLKSTYVDGLAEGGKYIWPDGLMHPILNVLGTVTGRLSSEQPNEQNFPKREHKEVRAQIIAPLVLSIDGKKRVQWVMLSLDYGQIEFRVIAMCTKDPKFIKIIWEKYDVHMEWAEKCAFKYPRVVGGKKFIKDKDVMKKFRSKIKNGFVFPSCYGAVPRSIAGNLEIPVEIAQELQDEFWDDFPSIPEWQGGIRKFYKKHGYVECLSGRRRRGPLGNEIINTPIQGSAADIVLDGMNRISEYAMEQRIPILQPRMNVHDDLTFMVPPSEKQMVLTTAVDFMLTPDFEYINVPLSVEASEGINWFEMKEVGTWFSNEWQGAL